MMNGWKVSQHTGIFKVLLAAVLVLSITAIPLPQISGWWQGIAEAAPPSEPPPGQLKRRGIVGVVISVDTAFTTSTTAGVATSTLPGVVMILGMQHGEVRVIVPDDVRVRSPQNEGIKLKETMGMKVAVLADKPPVDPNAAIGDDVIIRTVTAKKIMVIPGEALRTHGRGLVTAGAKGKGKGKFKLLGEDGEEQEIEIEDEDGLEEGDDVIYIKPKKGHGNASSTPITLGLRGLQKAEHIADRLTKLTDRLLLSADSPAAERLLGKIEKFQASVDKRMEKLEKQLQRLESRGVKFDAKVRGKLNRGRANNDDGDSPGKGKGRFGPAATDGDDTTRGKGKPQFRPTAGGDDTDGQGQNRGKRQNRNQNRNGDAVDCDNYDNADSADIPEECQDDEEDGGSSSPTTSSKSGKGGDRVNGQGRGKKN